ncbi:MAG: hypothetical protein VYE54_08215, partial [Pseudomonadota bacterium]|nr:hypothetical protein [Pseudomonadota bacterium]
CENEVQSFVPSGPFMMGCNGDRDSDCNPHAPLTQDTAEFPFHEVFVDTFIIDKNGKLVKVMDKFKTKTHHETLLEVLEELDLG